MKAFGLAEVEQAQMPHIKSLEGSWVRLIPACRGPWVRLPLVNHPSQQKAQDGFELTKARQPTTFGQGYRIQLRRGGTTINRTQTPKSITTQASVSITLNTTLGVATVGQTEYGK